MPNPQLQWAGDDAAILAKGDHYYSCPPDKVPPVSPLRHRDTGKVWHPQLNARPNVVVQGDAFDAVEACSLLDPPLPAAQLIYIDPPYNTGTIFIDYADGLSHNLWLGMMRTRLEALKARLAETGSIWVHVDDSEMAYTRVLLDSVFGRHNFIAQIVVEINPKGRQLDRYFAACHDYLLVYAKNAAGLRLEPGTTAAVNPKDFPLEGPEGRYRLLPLRNTNKRFNSATAPTMTYPLYAHPESGQVSTTPFAGAQEVMPVFGDLTPAVWRWSAPTVEVRKEELLSRWVRGRKGRRLDVFQIDRMHPGRRKKLKTIWPAQEVGSSDSAKLDLRKQFGTDIQFATPKPEPLLERIIAAATQPGDYVWDVFAGSGTTGVVAARLGRHFVVSECSANTIDSVLLPRLSTAGETPVVLEVAQRC